MFHAVTRSITTKFIVLFSVMLLAAIAVTGGISIYTSTQYVQQQIVAKGQDSLNALQIFLDDYKKQALMHAQSIAAHPQVIAGVQARDFSQLLSVTGPLMKAANLDYIVVTDSKGYVLLRTHEPTKLPRPDDSIANQKNVASALRGQPLAVIEEGKVVKMSIRSGYPVKDAAGNLIGVVSAGYTVNENNHSIVDKAKLLFGMDASIFSGKERVSTTVMNTSNARALGTVIDNQEIIKTVYEDKNVFSGINTVSGIGMFTMYTPIMIDGHVLGSIGIGVPLTAVAAVKNSLIRDVIWTSLVILLLFGLLNYWFVKRLTKPIAPLTATVEQVARGNLAVRPLTVASRDELGQLMTGFNHMLDNIRNIIKNVTDSSLQVASASEQLSASADYSVKAVNEVSAVMVRVAQTAETQKTAAVESAATAEEMSAGIQQIAANANEVGVTSEKTAQAASDGQAAIDRATEKMTSMVAAVNHSSDLVIKLGERSKEIGQITTVIAGIASQTNLLALNAAIEAARAGEQGRGFAVVAEEVRKLAEQSQEAARQIADLIKGVLTDTEQAVTAIGAGKVAVESGTAAVTAAGSTFGDIVTMVHDVAGQVREISAATQQMAAASQRTLQAIRSIEDDSNTIAGQTQSVASLTEEQLASFEEVAASSQNLAQMADTLQAATGKFHL